LTRSRFERDPHTTMQKITQTYSYSLGIVSSTVWRKSSQELEMKSFHLRRISINWMPFSIAQDSKSNFRNNFLQFCNWEKQNKTKEFSLNCDKLWVQILLFIFTGNAVVFREKWTRWLDRSQDWFSVNNW
jgi:hypothetical protein